MALRKPDLFTCESFIFVWSVSFAEENENDQNV